MSSLFENSDVHWPMLCVAYVICELCKHFSRPGQLKSRDAKRINKGYEWIIKVKKKDMNERTLG